MSQEQIQVVTYFLASLTVLAQILVVIFLGGYALAKKNKKPNKLTHFAKNYGFNGALIVAFTAMTGSLFYSDIAGYEPCLLCWYQRILMYPQVILFGIALWKKDMGIRIYSIALSLLGFIIAGYHYLLQIGVTEIAPCSAVGYSVSCADSFSMTFGYITIPMMATSAFALILTMMIVGKKIKK
ncbi:disulfide bond formation protein B [Candidatus Dojkabacteria bacterium]|uniref:Disulfide bond formation protein B n=1 Tax=Candidatus Dojkabacteria bacterium TaxID=2099670 RepID=A0A955L7X9_9BACT|nr:disulfide bond formation protein B [Candidatus Dojkabacteria bacterium]